MSFVIEFLFYLTLSSIFLVLFNLYLVFLENNFRKSFAIFLGIIGYITVCICLFSEILIASKIFIMDTSDRLLFSIAMWFCASLIAGFLSKKMIFEKLMSD